MRAYVLGIVAGCAIAAGSAQGVIVGPSGYVQDFNSMGQTGTAAPTDWSVWQGPSGTGNTTWTNTTGIPAAGVAGMVASATPLGAVTQNTAAPANGANNNNGVNFGFSGGSFDPNDRSLGTAPTTVSGSAIQVVLSNGFDAPLSDMVVSYDMRIVGPTTRFDAELTGYRVFYSVTGNAGPWISVTALDAINTATNAVGSALNRSATITFASPLAVGAEVRIRFVDDNAVAFSPDQQFSVDNFRAIPTPGTMSLLSLGGLLAARRRRAR